MRRLVGWVVAADHVSPPFELLKIPLPSRPEKTTDVPSRTIEQYGQVSLIGLEHTPELESQVPALWQASRAVQAMGFAPTQIPVWQESVRVHALPSLQGDPFALIGFEQIPVDVLQEPTVWHWSSAEQTTGFAPTQIPAWQESVRVQALPSLQGDPSNLTGLEQEPVAGLQVPALWHWSSAVQTSGLAPTQTPAWQVSVCVQALPSSQVAPSFVPSQAALALQDALDITSKAHNTSDFAGDTTKVLNK